MAACKRSVLYICTGNSCRSQMAEALLRHVAGDRFDAFSAGSRPSGFVHPLAMATLEKMEVSTEGLQSKHWSLFLEKPIDICITVCDNASAECPRWPNPTVMVHWALPDPTFAPGDDLKRAEFCQEVAERLRRKIVRLVALPQDLSPERLEAELAKLANL